MRNVQAWQIWTVVLVVVVAGGGYGAYLYLDDSTAENEQGTVQLVPVRRGTLVDDVSINGSLIYSIRETLTFRHRGFVAEVAVAVGQPVQAGEVLAVLDAATTSNLVKAVAQARVNIRLVEEALDEARSPYSASQIATAESGVANARVDLRNAEDVLDDFTKISDLEFAQTIRDLTDAQSAVAVHG